MIKFFIKSVLLCIPFFIILALSYCSLFALAVQLDGAAVGQMFAVAAVYMLFCWIFSAILNKIARRMSFVYWLICLGLSIAVLVYGLRGSYPMFVTDADVSVAKPAFTGFLLRNPVIVWRATLLMVIFPEMDGEWTTYLNTEVTYDSDGNEISTKSWFTHEYTNGTVVKIATIFAATLFATLIYNGNHKLAWLPFIVEGGICALCALVSFLYFFEIKR